MNRQIGAYQQILDQRAQINRRRNIILSIFSIATMVFWLFFFFHVFHIVIPIIISIITIFLYVQAFLVSRKNKQNDMKMFERVENSNNSGEKRTEKQKDSTFFDIQKSQETNHKDMGFSNDKSEGFGDFIFDDSVSTEDFLAQNAEDREKEQAINNHLKTTSDVNQTSTEKIAIKKADEQKAEKTLSEELVAEIHCEEPATQKSAERHLKIVGSLEDVIENSTVYEERFGKSTIQKKEKDSIKSSKEDKEKFLSVDEVIKLRLID